MKKKNLKILIGAGGCILLVVVILFVSGVLPLGSSVDSKYVTKYDNGDTVYSQGEENLAIDEETYTIYYDNLLVVFTSGDLSNRKAKALANEVGGTVVGDISGCINVLQIQVPSTDLATLNEYANTLMESDDVLYAGYDIPVTIDAEDDNPWSDDGTVLADKGDESSPDGNDWWAEAIGAYTAWEIMDNLSDSLSDITIGIVDNGFDTDHADLANKITVLNENSVESDHHGTLVAGVIGATNNDIGIRGVADNATLIAADFKVPSRADDGTILTDENGGIVYDSVSIIELTKLLIEGGARVINNSLGSSDTSYLSKLVDELLVASGSYRDNDLERERYELFLEAHSRTTATYTVQMMCQLYINGYLGEDTDILFVQSAGNGYDYIGGALDADMNWYYCSVTEESFETAMESVSLISDDDETFTYEFVKDHILVVGAVENETTETGAYKMVKRFNYGDVIDICAPGEDIYSTDGNNGYSSHDGTSLSAPMVSGAAALVWSLNPDLSAGEVKEILISTASVAVGVNDEDEGETYPMLNVGSAVIRTVSGTITGTIVDSETGETITGVTCTLTNDVSSSDFFTTPTTSGASDGSFTVSAIGNCTILLEKSGYESVELTVPVGMREDVDIGEVSMIRISNEDLLLAQLDELVETYGLFTSGQTGTISSSSLASWLDPTGIISADILDLDQDGMLELLVCRTDEWTYYGTTYYKYLLEVYEADSQRAYLADSMYLEPYLVSQNEYLYLAVYATYSMQTTMTVNAVELEDGYYLVCDYYDRGLIADGTYEAAWVLEYSGEELQYVCTYEDDGAHSSYVAQFAYEFEDGIITKTTVYYDPWMDDPGYYDSNYEFEIYEEDSKEQFFAQYGLTDDTETESVFELNIYATDSSMDSNTYVTTCNMLEELTRGSDLLDSYE